MEWAMLYLFVGLKIPILMLGLIVWWAVRQGPEPLEPEGGDGGQRTRPHQSPSLPRPPRRGPHGDPAPLPPPRVRKVTARARQLDR
ncbi:MAG TPA: hypothetical protein VE526_03700 [Solirubrobacteraceae bacterium]|jgi:hypothetical protein|nr:hypothetical protein [Solirubrobacteraceae bacterium]